MYSIIIIITIIIVTIVIICSAADQLLDGVSASRCGPGNRERYRCVRYTEVARLARK